MTISKCTQKIDPSVHPSIMSTYNNVKNQVQFDCFANLRTKWVNPLYGELCFIISEVLVMNPDTHLKINGSCIHTYVVQEVFLQLRNYHLRLVRDNFQNVSCQVYNKKAYLRTALYNAFFEHEAHIINLTE